MRYSLFSILSVVSAVSLVIFIFIMFRSYIERRQDRQVLINSDKETKSIVGNIGQKLKLAAELLKTRNMLLLLFLFGFLGKYFNEFTSFFT